MSVRSVLLLVAVVALIVLPLILGGAFTGADGEAADLIDARPDFVRWAEPVWTPPSTEIESLLFALQAAFGASVIAYVIGRRHGALAERRRKDTTSEAGA